MNDKVMALIGLDISNSMLMDVLGEATIKKSWDKLGLLYQARLLMNLIFPWKKLYALNMKDGDNIIYHINASNALLNLLYHW